MLFDGVFSVQIQMNAINNKKKMDFIGLTNESNVPALPMSALYIHRWHLYSIL